MLPLAVLEWSFCREEMRQWIVTLQAQHDAWTGRTLFPRVSSGVFGLLFSAVLCTEAGNTYFSTTFLLLWVEESNPSCEELYISYINLFWVRSFTGIFI